ncbi:MAG: hypothetical protein DRP62_07465 [Planctomycetota bacterium]|nr:MAG: hypothetical protein DRP62_07465 [Planctomycetota bacterium]
MRKQIHNIYHRVLVLLHLSPLSLAEKCRIAFGIAVLLVLLLALSIPYIWMGRLTEKAALDAGRAKADLLFRQHFQQAKTISETPGTAGIETDANNPEICWIDFTKQDENQLQQLTDSQREMIEFLKNEKTRDDNTLLEKRNGVLQSSYIKIFRATETYQPIAAVVIQKPAGGISQTIFMNRVWIIVAGLIAGAGAIIAFYMITQRVILRPIRQLRALANNVAEGNLDIRSAIKTGDEYEKLADAFNHMLDGLQETQQKLRQANKQLDDKIVELSERNIELFKANKLKSEFLANISHEFKTPLNAILGFAEILREKPEALKKDKARRYAENIITGGKNLLNMINDLLDLAKTEAGKMKLHIEKTTVAGICDVVVSSLAALTRKKKIKVKLTVDDNIPNLYTDAGKVQQILYNFMSNAVKFTPKRGRIEIRAAMMDEKTVRITVTDTGCGIAEADKEKIFEKFRQADGSITRQSTGSGLGLAISKELATMLAGSIGMESEPGCGSTFWLDIPVTLTKEQEKQPG